jgi:hypothetical protein
MRQMWLRAAGLGLAAHLLFARPAPAGPIFFSTGSPDCVLDDGPPGLSGVRRLLFHFFRGGASCVLDCVLYDG